VNKLSTCKVDELCEYAGRRWRRERWRSRIRH